MSLGTGVPVFIGTLQVQSAIVPVQVRKLKREVKRGGGSLDYFKSYPKGKL